MTSQGKEITNWSQYGIELTIPPGAVPEGKEVLIQVHCCFTGPFFVPDGYRSCSPVYIILPSLKFTKEVELRIYHHAFLSTEEDCSRMSFITGASTPNTDSHSGARYQFQLQEGGAFKPHLSQPYGTMHLKHFCNKSIAVEDSVKESKWGATS